MFNKINSRETLRITLQMVFVASLVAANLTASKLVTYPFPFVGELTGSVAAAAIGVTFFCSDLLSEIYGKETAHRTVMASVVAMVVAYGLVFFAIEMPAAPSYGANEQFVDVMGASYPIILASIASIAVSQNLDISLFHWIRGKTGSGHKWVRNVGSTATSQLFDTAFFTVLAFMIFPPLFGGSAVPIGIAIGIISAEYIVKVVVAILDTPLFYAISGVAEPAPQTAEPEVGD
jgi:uncharacterized integral membrane protein (TIGR00697 family)